MVGTYDWFENNYRGRSRCTQGGYEYKVTDIPLEEFIPRDKFEQILNELGQHYWEHDQLIDVKYITPEGREEHFKRLITHRWKH
jgi:hypothetical protein